MEVNSTFAPVVVEHASELWQIGIENLARRPGVGCRPSIIGESARTRRPRHVLAHRQKLNCSDGKPDRDRPDCEPKLDECVARSDLAPSLPRHQQKNSVSSRREKEVLQTM